MALILAVDTSAKPVSCALAQDDKLLASFYSNTGLTHSQTLMPMIDDLLKVAGVSVRDLDALAVNAGPGSFTGVRIGVSAVKGLAFTDDLPCISVSTLECMAECAVAEPGSLICCLMDARCHQVYTALFEKDASGNLIRLTQDEALTMDQLLNELLTYKRPVILVGDGSELCYRAWNGAIPDVILAPPAVRFQNAAGTALVASRMWQKGMTISSDALQPIYLRLPQAERELNARLQQE